jgi:hypothetical protein
VGGAAAFAGCAVYQLLREAADAVRVVRRPRRPWDLR